MGAERCILNEAERLDPRNASVFTVHATNYICLRRFPEALRKLEQVLDITPDDVDALALKASIAQAEGRPAASSSTTRSAVSERRRHPGVEAQVYQTILERRPRKSSLG